MAMTVAEANAVGLLLRWLGVTREPRAAVTQEEIARVQEAALILAAGARKRLMAGDRDEEIRAGIARFFADASVQAWPPRAGDTWRLYEIDADDPETEHTSVWVAVVVDDGQVRLVEANRPGGTACPQDPEELRWQGRMLLAYRPEAVA